MGRGAFVVVRQTDYRYQIEARTRVRAPSTLRLPVNCAERGQQSAQWRAQQGRCKHYALAAFPRPADRAHHPALAAAAVEQIAAVGLQARHPGSGRHREFFQNRSRARIDPPQFTRVAVPTAVPEFALNPGDPGDEAVRFDRAQDRSGLRIDLMDFSIAIVTDPERPFGPSEPRVGAAAGSRDRGQYAPALGIDFLNAILGELVEIFAIKSRARVGRNIDRTRRLAAHGIEGVQLVARCEPDVPTVKRKPVYVVDA